MPKAKPKLKSYCNECKREQFQKILKSHETSYSDDENCVSGTTFWEIIECGGCQTISFREVEWFSEFTDERGKPYQTIRAYPQADANALPIKPFLNVPPKIRKVYGEVIETFNRGNTLLCAGGLRAIIEGICSAKHIKTGPVTVKNRGGGSRVVRQKNLRAKIEGMFEKGLITKEHRRTLHEHRFLGNEALHELAPPERAELAIAVSIIEHTLEHLYEIQDQAAKLRALKKQRKSRAGAKARFLIGTSQFRQTCAA